MEAAERWALKLSALSLFMSLTWPLCIALCWSCLLSLAFLLSLPLYLEGSGCCLGFSNDFIGERL